jgi:Mce-associated membrane protein
MTAEKPDADYAELSEPTDVDAQDHDDLESQADTQIDQQEEQATDKPVHRRLSHVGWAVTVGSVALVAVVGLVGWLGYSAYATYRAQVQHDAFVQVARQGALNLTTISYTEVDADVQRILDSATGAFRDDFEKRSRPFIEIVKQAQSKSEGEITEAAVESEHADSARILVAVSVKTENGAGEQEPREWRMRIDVRKVGDGAKMSNVEFVA